MLACASKETSKECESATCCQRNLYAGFNWHFMGDTCWLEPGSFRRLAVQSRGSDDRCYQKLELPSWRAEEQGGRAVGQATQVTAQRSYEACT